MTHQPLTIDTTISDHCHHPPSITTGPPTYNHHHQRPTPIIDHPSLITFMIPTHPSLATVSTADHPPLINNRHRHLQPSLPPPTTISNTYHHHRPPSLTPAATTNHHLSTTVHYYSHHRSHSNFNNQLSFLSLQLPSTIDHFCDSHLPLLLKLLL